MTRATSSSAAARSSGLDGPTSAHSLADLAAEGILLRVFCTFYGDKVVLLLSCLDKGADPKAQPRAIRSARKFLADWQAEQAAAGRRSRKR